MSYTRPSLFTSQKGRAICHAPWQSSLYVSSSRTNHKLLKHMHSSTLGAAYPFVNAFCQHFHLSFVVNTFNKYPVYLKTCSISKNIPDYPTKSSLGNMWRAARNMLPVPISQLNRNDRKVYGTFLIMEYTTRKNLTRFVWSLIVQQNVWVFH
jgi:hypothetical protein